MGSVKTLIAILVMASLTLGAEAMAQTQAPPPAGQRVAPPGSDAPARGEEKMVEGQVKSVDPSGTEVTLTDGTKLVTPSGAIIRPGALTEGTTVIARYTEENGEKVLTGLAVKEPSASPPTEPRSPGAPSTPPAGAPKRY